MQDGLTNINTPKECEIPVCQGACIGVHGDEKALISCTTDLNCWKVNTIDVKSQCRKKWACSCNWSMLDVQ